MGEGRGGDYSVSNEVTPTSNWQVRFLRSTEIEPALSSPIKGRAIGYDVNSCSLSRFSPPPAGEGHHIWQAGRGKLLTPGLNCLIDNSASALSPSPYGERAEAGTAATPWPPRVRGGGSLGAVSCAIALPSRGRRRKNRKSHRFGPLKPARRRASGLRATRSGSLWLSASWRRHRGWIRLRKRSRSRSPDC
jgi:hypothetical protein